MTLISGMHTDKLLKKYLPVPYTFILPSNKALHRPFKKRKTVGVRIPKHTVVLEIVKQLGNPILTTSIHDEDAIIEYTTDPDVIFDDWRSSSVMPPSPVVVDVPIMVAAKPSALLALAPSAPKLMPAMVIGISSLIGFLA